MQVWCNDIEVKYLPRPGSGHSLMLHNFEIYVVRHRKHFRALNFKTENDTSSKVVILNCCTTSSNNPYQDFKKNIKRVKGSLTRWSREVYGDIFKQLLSREDIMKIKEMLFEEEPSVVNRQVLQRPQVEYKKYLLLAAKTRV